MANPTGKNGNGRVPEARRLAIVADAIVYGESEAARRHGVNRKSIATWLEPVGGLPAVRAHYAGIRDGALAEMERATAITFAKKVCQFSNEHLLQAFTEMLQARKVGGTTIVNAPSASAQAGANVSDDGIGRAILAAERAFLAECQRPALGEAERPALESNKR